MTGLGLVKIQSYVFNIQQVGIPILSSEAFSKAVHPVVLLEPVVCLNHSQCDITTNIQGYIGS